ncbi:MAG: leucine-rich repeat domain-containing protein, partial [Clostridia bacterium]|nr:leucine-rich repeat domain-containing protein [Clostridia bacterium]
MKTNGKRIFSVLLSLLMVLLPCAALTAAAADTPEVLASGYCGGEGDGTNLTWKITDDGVLTVSGHGAMGDYAEIRENEMNGKFIAVTERPWDQSIYEIVTRDYDPEVLASLSEDQRYTREYIDISSAVSRGYATLISAVVVEENVTSVGAGAFAGFWIRSVSLPSTLYSIGDKAFYSTALSYIELPEGLVSIGEWAFRETPLIGAVLPSTLQSIGEQSFYFTRLKGITVRGNRLPAGDLPVLCSYTRTDMDVNEYYTAVTVQNLAGLLYFLINDGVYGTWYGKQAELWGMAEDGALFVEGWFTPYLLEYERLTGVHVEWDSYYGVRDAYLAAISDLLETEITFEQVARQADVTVGFTDDFCETVKAYQRANGDETYNVALLYYKLLNEDQNIQYRLQTTSLSLEEILRRRDQELSELYNIVLANCGEEVSDLETAKAVTLAKLNEDLGTSYTEAQVMVIYPAYQVDYTAMNAALIEMHGREIGQVLPLNVCWITLDEAADGVYDGMSVFPMPCYSLRTCNAALYTVAAAAGVTTEALDHTWELTSTAVPTCTSVGTKTYTCIYCGAEKTEDYAPVLNHTPVNVDATEPTYDEHGYTAGVYCAQCDTWLSGHEVIHNTFGHREVLRQPTTEEEGSVIITCTVCGEQGLYAIEKLAPSEPEPEPAEPD